MTNNVNLSKINQYAVTQQDDLELSKINQYAVTQLVGVRNTKINTYASKQTAFGVFYQDVDSKRPVYRAAPSGGIPYVDMSSTDAELKVRVPFTDTYTFIVYYADETFDNFESDLTAGENVVPITDDFNQAALIRGANIHRYVIGSVEEGMKARVA